MASERGYRMLISNQLVKYECPLVLGALVQTLVSHGVSQFPLTIMSSLVPRPTHVRHLQRNFVLQAMNAQGLGMRLLIRLPLTVLWVTNCVPGYWEKE